MADINQKIAELEQIKKSHLVSAKKMLEADNGNLFPFDLFATGIHKRSMSLIDGFIKTIPDNFFCAAPLVRLQLDNLLRLFAHDRVSVNVHDFTLDVMSGKSIRSMKDKDTGEKLTDAHLVEKFKEIEPRVEALYKETSGYIHFSEKHIFNTISIDNGERTLRAYISEKDEFITNQLRLEAIAAMIAITKLLLWQLDSWTFTKNNAELAKQARAQGFNYVVLKGSNEDDSNQSTMSDGLEDQYNQETLD